MLKYSFSPTQCSTAHTCRHPNRKPETENFLLNQPKKKALQTQLCANRSFFIPLYSKKKSLPLLTRVNNAIFDRTRLLWTQIIPFYSDKFTFRPKLKKVEIPFDQNNVIFFFGRWTLLFFTILFTTCTYRCEWFFSFFIFIWTVYSIYCEWFFRTLETWSQLKKAALYKLVDLPLVDFKFITFIFNNKIEIFFNYMIE